MLKIRLIHARRSANAPRLCSKCSMLWQASCPTRCLNLPMSPSRFHTGFSTRCLDVSPTTSLSYPISPAVSHLLIRTLAHLSKEDKYHLVNSLLSSCLQNIIFHFRLIYTSTFLPSPSIFQSLVSWSCSRAVFESFLRLSKSPPVIHTSIERRVEHQSKISTITSHHRKDEQQQQPQLKRPQAFCLQRW